MPPPHRLSQNQRQQYWPEFDATFRGKTAIVKTTAATTTTTTTTTTTGAGRKSTHLKKVDPDDARARAKRNCRKLTRNWL